jgi:hypothetical protein
MYDNASGVDAAQGTQPAPFTHSFTPGGTDSSRAVW